MVAGGNGGDGGGDQMMMMVALREAECGRSGGVLGLVRVLMLMC
jgi:hypothetical protein